MVYKTFSHHRFSACNHLEKINCIRTFPRLEKSMSCSSSSQLPTLQVRYVIVNTQSMVSFMVIICKKLVQILKYFSDWQHLSFELRLLLCALQSWDSLRLSQLDLRMDVHLIKIESSQIRTWNWSRNRQFLLASLAQAILRPSKELCRGFNQNSILWISTRTCPSHWLDVWRKCIIYFLINHWTWGQIQWEILWRCSTSSTTVGKVKPSRVCKGMHDHFRYSKSLFNWTRLHRTATHTTWQWYLKLCRQ